jgi:hypothetical protein
LFHNPNSLQPSRTKQTRILTNHMPIKPNFFSHFQNINHDKIFKLDTEKSHVVIKRKWVAIFPLQFN